MGVVYDNLQEWEKSIQISQQCIEIARKTDDLTSQVIDLHNQGHTCFILGDTATAKQLLHQSSRISKMIDMPSGIAYSQWWLGEIALFEGQTVQAIETLQNARTLMHQSEESYFLPTVMTALARALFEQGQYDAARAHLRSVHAMPNAESRREALID